MKINAKSHCPLCGGKVIVTEMQCTNCRTSYKGVFYLSKFQRLNDEMLRFVEIFLINEGNISAAAKELGWSYPKIKNMLKKIARALGYKLPEAVQEEEELLKQLENGEISVEEAYTLLNKKQGGM